MVNNFGALNKTNNLRNDVTQVKCNRCWNLQRHNIFMSKNTPTNPSVCFRFVGCWVSALQNETSHVYILWCIKKFMIHKLNENKMFFLSPLQRWKGFTVDVGYSVKNSCGTRRLPHTTRRRRAVHNMRMRFIYIKIKLNVPNRCCPCSLTKKKLFWTQYPTHLVSIYFIFII